MPIGISNYKRKGRILTNRFFLWHLPVFCHLQHKQRQGYHTEAATAEDSLATRLRNSWLDPGASVGAQMWRASFY